MASSLAAWPAIPSALAMASSRSAASQVALRLGPRPLEPGLGAEAPGDGGGHGGDVPGGGLALRGPSIQAVLSAPTSWKYYAHRQEAGALASHGAGVG